MSSAGKVGQSRWLVAPAPRPDAAARLLCLPYAGGAANVFRSWPSRLRALDVEVLAVEFPGRGRRTGEPPGWRVEDLVADAVSWIDRPYAVFGHSIGARVGFELCRGLRAAGLPEPVRLYVSGSPGPRLPRVGFGDSRLPDEEFVRRLIGMGGTPAELLRNPELRNHFLPIFRSDFAWEDGYVYRPEPELSCPMTAFAGVDDPEAPVSQVETWSAETRGDFRLRVLPGGHFFVHEEFETIVNEFATDLPPGRVPFAADGSGRAE